MNFLVFNLPYNRKIVRKYSCSYLAPNFLYPPLELLRVATIIKESGNNNVVFIDAIAEGLGDNKSLLKIKKTNPDFLIVLTSVDFINEEYEFIKKIKKEIKIKIILIGYLPFLFFDHFSEADVILGNNFESIIKKTIIDTNNDCDFFIKKLKENSYKDFEFNPDIIKKVDNSFIKDNLYSDFFVKGKTAFTYFSFGCPYSCSFCVKTYNLSKAYYRNRENIFSELLDYSKKKYKNIRILDDNCTLNKDILSDILEFQKINNIFFNYYGLSRLDLLDESTINLLGQLNFKRILIGLETINKEVQKKYNKKIIVDEIEIKKKFKSLKKAGIEIFVFIMVDPSIENKNDLKKTMLFLKKNSIDFTSISYIIPYPGTVYFNENKEKIDFCLNPFYSKLKNKYYSEFEKNKIFFFISFYLFNFRKFYKFIFMTIKNPKQTFLIIKSFLSYFLFSKKKRDNFF